MATEFYGIIYFPTKSAFFEGAISESMEAKYGIKGPYFLIKILCKIYKEGYFIPWDEEQCEIFAYRLGREYTKEDVTNMITLLLDKGFFDKASYENDHILTSIDIQRVWVEATNRRKKNFEALPYLLEEIKCKQKERTKTENEDNSPVQMELKLENEDISRQRKGKERKVEERMKKDENLTLSSPPEYALNPKTHNYDGLLLALDQVKVKDIGDIEAILRLSNYGELGNAVWKMLAQTSWSKIGMPGKYLIKSLRSA